MRRYVLASGIVFDVLTAVQLLRLFLRWPVVVNGVAVPLWGSAVAVLVVGTMAVWAARLLTRPPTVDTRPAL